MGLPEEGGYSLVRHRRDHCRVFGEKMVSVGGWVSVPLGHIMGTAWDRDVVSFV